MERIYVTEIGAINNYGNFESFGVVGVNRTAKEAVKYIIEDGALPIKREIRRKLKEITYKKNETEGYRISIQTLWDK